ncbi:MAG: BNR-4 repeat-containing protein [Marinilabiliaceae bacterium]|nr:BNR-4 repeat-containing protein [Marinilabiliaceae bacterium]
MKMFLILLLASSISFAQSQTIISTASADAYCRDGSYINANYGSEGQITTKKVNSQTSNYNRKSYVKFDLTDVEPTNMKDAVLRLYNDYVEGSGFNIDVFETDASWVEGTINWSNAPVFGEKTTTFIVGSSGTYSEISVKASILKQLESSYIISYGLYMTKISNTNNVIWTSKESTSGKAPELVITYITFAPTSVEAIKSSASQTNLTWDASKCNSDQLLVERRTVTSDFDTLVVFEQPFPNAYSDTDVDNGNSYYYRVTAINTDGNNSQSVIVSTIGTADMEYVSSVCNQTITSDVYPTSQNIELIQICIETKYDKNPLVVKDLDINLNGTTSVDNISAINVYYSGADAEINTNEQFGESNINPTIETITVSDSKQLLPGKNYFWIAANIKSSASEGNIVDGQCTNISIQGASLANYIPLVTDPEGSRLIAPIIETSIMRISEEVISTTGTSFTNTNLVSFCQDVIRTFNGYQYAAYWDNSKKVAVARKKIGAAIWEILILENYTSINDLTDNHYNISMGLCPSDGTIHLSYDHHAHDLNYRKTTGDVLTNPESIEWDSSLFGNNMDALNGTTKLTKVTYPRFITKPDGNLIFAYRYGSSGNGDEYLWEYKGLSHSWSVVGKIVDGISSGENAYFHGIQYDKFGKLHMAWCWRQTSAPETNHDLFYAYSEDDGRNWKNTFGATVGTTGSNPLKLSTTGLKVYNIPQHRSLMNQESMCVDNNGRVHVLNGIIKDEDPDVDIWGTTYPTHFYRKDDGTWQKNFMPLESKKNRDQMLCDAQNNIYILLDNNIYMASELSNWINWKIVGQKSLGASYWGEGTVDKYNAINNNVLSLAAAKSGSLVQVNFLIDQIGQGTGKGLTTDFFNNSNFTDFANTTVGSIDYNWGINSPFEGVSAIDYSVRWNGTLETRLAEKHTLYFTASEGVKIWINDELVLDKMDNTNLNEFIFSFTPIASHKNKIEIRSIHKNVPAEVKLSWKSLRQSKTVVPKSSLYEGISDEVITSVYDKKTVSICSIYPNPAFSTIFLNHNGSDTFLDMIKIIDTSGKTVMTKKNIKINGAPVSIDISHLPVGIYYVNIDNIMANSMKLVKTK